jgi:hypothetical protein
MERLHQQWPAAAQLRAVDGRKVSEFLLPLLRQVHADLPLIRRAARAHHQISFLQTVNQADCAVMPDQEVLG